MGNWFFDLFNIFRPRTQNQHSWYFPTYNKYIRRCSTCGRTEMFFMRSRFSVDDPPFGWQGLKEDKGCTL